jgi:hypothetical protein
MESWFNVVKVNFLHSVLEMGFFRQLFWNDFFHTITMSLRCDVNDPTFSPAIAL